MTAVRPLIMARHFRSAAVLTIVSLSAVALFPVFARDLEGSEFTDPLDLVLPSEPAAAIEPSASALEPADQSDLAIVEPREASPEPLLPPPPPLPTGPVVISTHSGEASWYGPGFYGNRTASGEVYRKGTMTAAHRTLPFGTRVRVTNLWNGRIAVVRINDRGPFVGHRVIDLGHGAAHELGLVNSGIAQVRLEVLR